MMLSALRLLALAGLCGAQSGAGDKKSSEVTLTKGDSKGDVTLTKALNNSKEPSLRHSLTAPVVKVVGEDAMLTCVVRNQGNYTLMWKKTRVKQESNVSASSRILTANMLRVTRDKRVRVMHEKGGEVYVLLISNVTVGDAGLYTCEVNFNPVLRSFHQLKC